MMLIIMGLQSIFLNKIISLNMVTNRIIWLIPIGALSRTGSYTNITNGRETHSLVGAWLAVGRAPGS